MLTEQAIPILLFVEFKKKNEITHKIRFFSIATLKRTLSIFVQDPVDSIAYQRIHVSMQ